MSLVLPADVRARLVAWSAAERPREACGLLIGERAGARFRVLRAVLADNVSRGPRTRRFEVDPGAVVATDDEARAAGLELVGVWHSHPDSSARPSEHDVRGAQRGWVHVIVGAGDELSAWTVGAAGALEAERLEDPGRSPGSAEA